MRRRLAHLVRVINGLPFSLAVTRCVVNGVFLNVMDAVGVRPTLRDRGVTIMFTVYGVVISKFRGRDKFLLLSSARYLACGFF